MKTWLTGLVVRRVALALAGALIGLLVEHGVLSEPAAEQLERAVEAVVPELSAL